MFFTWEIEEELPFLDETDHISTYHTWDSVEHPKGDNHEAAGRNNNTIY